MSEQIVFSCTVYDNCKQQECLSAGANKHSKNKIISPAKNGTGFPIRFFDNISKMNMYIEPDEIFYFTSKFYSVDIVEDSFETIMRVKRFTKNLTKAGYYDLEIEYRFNFAIEFFDFYDNPIYVSIQDTPVLQVQAYTTYTKKVTLFGGEIVRRVTTLNSCGSQCCSEFPEYNIQATADIIDSSIVKLSSLKCNPYITLTNDTLEGHPIYAINVTIGLFTIISLMRQNRVNMLTGEPVDIPTCSHGFEPCEEFNFNIFPTDIFNVDRQ